MLSEDNETIPFVSPYTQRIGMLYPMLETIPLLVVAGQAAFSVEGFRETFSMGRNLAYDEIKAGRLKMRKVGRRTIIRAEDAKAWLDSLPEAPQP